tara:strand:- start:902 stop:1159 length:258 start_codon:yes stop_codon:yes gene_type:complete
MGKDISGAIYAAAYGSINRIHGEATRSMGMTPKAYRAVAAGEEITYSTTITALGPMTMAATKKGVFCAVWRYQNHLNRSVKKRIP